MCLNNEGRKSCYHGDGYQLLCWPCSTNNSLPNHRWSRVGEVGKWGKRYAFLIRKFWRSKQWYGNSLASLPDTQPSWLDSTGNMHMPIQTSKPHAHPLTTFVSLYSFGCHGNGVYHLAVLYSQYLSVYLSIYLSVYLSICLSIYLSIYLSIPTNLYARIWYDSYSHLNCLLQLFSGSRPFHWRLWPFQSRQSSGQNPQLLECSLLPNHSAQSACNETQLHSLWWQTAIL